VIAFDTHEYGRLPAQAEIYRAALALLAGDTAATSAHAERVLTLIEPSDHLGRGSATALLGLARWAEGDLEQARLRYGDAVESFLRADHISDLLGCSLALADIQIAQGRLGDARRTYESALQHARRAAVLRGTADMHVGLSEILIQQNDLEGAARHQSISSELGEHAGLPQHAYRQRVAGALLADARGDVERAVELLDEAAPLYDTDFSPPVRPVAAVTARVRLKSGDHGAALRWADGRRADLSGRLDYISEYEHITLARTMLAGADRSAGADEALALLDRLLGAAESGRRESSVIEILVLIAAAHLLRRDRDAAVAALEEALRRAEPESMVRVFLDVVPPLDGLVDAVPDRGPAGSIVDRLRAVRQPTHSRPTTRAALVDPLSDRELDVLRLLRTDLSGPEIARQLHVSLNTLRTHTKHIYTKLDAGNRREAVRRAAELGL
jgi:LuxR family maltose regulon positive regulatory protein